MPSETPAIPDGDRIDHYFEVLAYCLGQCADHRDDGHDVFLWNARRASEAIIYALAEGTAVAAQISGQAKDRKPIDHADLIVQLRRQNRLHPTHAQYLEIIRAAGNLGAHAQPEKIVDAVTLTGCVNAIPMVVDWLFDSSPLRRPLEAPGPPSDPKPASPPAASPAPESCVAESEPSCIPPSTKVTDRPPLMPPSESDRA